MAAKISISKSRWTGNWRVRVESDDQMDLVLSLDYLYSYHSVDDHMSHVVSIDDHMSHVVSIDYRLKSSELHINRCFFEFAEKEIAMDVWRELKAFHSKRK